jgi:ABC-type arginine/histidine transport system permease subunit
MCDSDTMQLGMKNIVLELMVLQDVMASLYEISAHYCRNVCILCAAGVLYQALSFVLHLVLKLGARYINSI